MKREFLKQMGLDKLAIDRILSVYGGDVERYKREITRYAGLIGELEKRISQWEDEANRLTRELYEREYDCCVERFLAEYRFSSGLAREAASQALRLKRFPFANGRLAPEAEEYIFRLHQQDAAAFAEPPHKPRAVRSKTDDGRKLD